MRADLHPCAPIGTLIRICRETLRTMKAKHVDRAIVLLDLDGRAPCPAGWAREFQAELTASVGTEVPDGVFAVIKNQRFENWLIADTAAVNRLAKFNLSNADENQIRHNADGVDAPEILRAAAQRASSRRHRRYTYDKISDAQALFSLAEPLQTAAASRSFRRFMRVAGCPRYSAQSKQPCQTTGASGRVCGSVRPRAQKRRR
ncbi:MAG: DUF4276 family protein [Candidatus Eremiobacteraeota bacterium]|nr:DUF4276 family protein [Candidatus Eremiobacteraeota bacterium]